MTDTKQADVGSMKESFAAAPVVSNTQTAFRAKLIEILKSQEEILPPSQSSLGKLVQIFQSPNSSVEDIVEIIKLDPAMTARIFRVANSPTYRGNATTISEGVIHLGFAQVRQIVFSEGFFKRFAQIKLPPGMEHFWLRNLLVARLAERLGAKCKLFGGMEYLAGLLHDTGWLLLGSSFHEELALIEANGKPAPFAEKEVLSFTHAEIAAAICARSLLPPRVMAAVTNHHTPLTLIVEGIPPKVESPAVLGVLLCVCDQLADAAGLEIPWQKSGATVASAQASREAVCLGQFGQVSDFQRLLDEELPKAKEISAALTGGK